MSVSLYVACISKPTSDFFLGIIYIIIYGVSTSRAVSRVNLGVSSCGSPYEYDRLSRSWWRRTSRKRPSIPTDSAWSLPTKLFLPIKLNRNPNAILVVMTVLV